ncbi:hypothetical protein HF325_004451 [Metschnikowia pulcherrima]|uniref:Uncharacterized protein n=1 Tax=Metschnikowia pulcherrima TaxID=27326 RepID=A0A8H7GPE6_9ASCO|nr:hypothetical protein HF325_004451 [Metschnikowia pulcherrima]
MARPAAVIPAWVFAAPLGIVIGPVLFDSALEFVALPALSVPFRAVGAMELVALPSTSAPIRTVSFNPARTFPRTVWLFPTSMPAADERFKLIKVSARIRNCIVMKEKKDRENKWHLASRPSFL